MSNVVEKVSEVLRGEMLSQHEAIQILALVAQATEGYPFRSDDSVSVSHTVPSGTNRMLFVTPHPSPAPPDTDAPASP